jgi:hypothetical protein
MIKRVIDLDIEQRELERKLKSLKKEINTISAAVIERLDDRDAKSSEKYDFGHVTVQKPSLKASYSKTNSEDVFKFLRDNGAGSLIQETVSTNSMKPLLSSMIIEENKKIPESITIYFDRKLKIYPKKGVNRG